MNTLNFGKQGYGGPTIHSESKIVVGIANTITRAILTLGMKLAMEYNQMERGVGLVRALGQGSTDIINLTRCWALPAIPI